MFVDRCLGLPGCGHSTNWSCPCTCDEEIYRRDYAPATSPAKPTQQAEIDRLKTQIEGLVRYAQHETGCHANEFDYLDKSPCTCGLRKFYSPKGAAPVAGTDADMRELAALIELAAEAMWRRDYPNGGSVYKTYESLNFRDKELHRKEALEYVRALPPDAGAPIPHDPQGVISERQVAIPPERDSEMPGRRPRGDASVASTERADG